MDQNFLEQLFKNHHNSEGLPSKFEICEFAEGILQLLFPQLSKQEFESVRDVKSYYGKLHHSLVNILSELKSDCKGEPDTLADQFMDQLPGIYKNLLLDAEALVSGDPAAHNMDEVMGTYPGFFAIAIYRIAHTFVKMGIPSIPRILSEHAHAKTGIDINPGAKIGTSFFIDHGTGLVIGETAVVGNNVKVYQGVTLGALSVTKEMAKVKRHPTIEDNVIIYAGATILGGDTVIGKNSTIGGNVWLIESVPPYSRVYNTEQVKISQGDSSDKVGIK